MWEEVMYDVVKVVDLVRHFCASCQRHGLFDEESFPQNFVSIIVNASPPSPRRHAFFLFSPPLTLIKAPFLVPQLLPLKSSFAAPQTCCQRNADRSTFAGRRPKSAPPRAVRPTSHIVHVASTLTRILTFRRTALLFLGL